MEQLVAAAGIKGVGTPEPLANARHGADLETGEPRHMNRISSKVSVPLDRRNSFLSQQGGDGTQDGTEGHEDDADDEFAWGPSHPCFPHQNAHVPLDSPLYSSTRIIRVKRDWMVAGDLAPTFANLYPEVLDPLVSEETFRSVINKINMELMAAFSPWSGRAVMDAILGAATLWLWDDLGFTGVKTRLRKLEQWIEEWNRKIGEPEGVKIIELRRTGYLTLDFQIPDPQIGVEAQQANNRQSVQPPAPAVLASDQGHGPGPGVYEYQPTHNFATQHLSPMPQAVA